MPVAKFTIDDSEAKINLVSQFLETHDVHFSKDSGVVEERRKKNQALAKVFREKPPFTGHGQELAKLRKEFRDDFVL